jgi:hypothetical protein
MKKTTVILGVGGHGWESLSDYIEQSDSQILMYSQTTDWGGFTGMLGRLMEYNNGELNQILHGKILPVLPWGDFNKRLVYYLTKKYGSLVGETFDFRSFHIWELKQEFEIISDFLALDPIISSHFEVYLENFCKYFDLHSEKLPEIKPICLGNLWNQYLFWQLGSLENWNDFYRQHGILPENLEFLFTELSRNILVGETIKGEKNVGEDILDVSEVAVLPKSLKILEANLAEFEPSEDFLEKLEKADLIIFPNGSIANWLPFLNNLEIQLILKSKADKKQLIWLMNLFHTPNELKIHEYIKYVYSLGIFPIIIAPKDIKTQPDKDILQKYEQEKKFLNLANQKDISELMELNQNQLFELEYNLNQTFKYSAKSITQSLLKISHEN